MGERRRLGGGALPRRLGPDRALAPGRGGGAGARPPGAGLPRDEAGGARRRRARLQPLGLWPRDVRAVPPARDCGARRRRDAKRAQRRRRNRGRHLRFGSGRRRRETRGGRRQCRLRRSIHAHAFRKQPRPGWSGLAHRRALFRPRRRRRAVVPGAAEPLAAEFFERLQGMPAEEVIRTVGVHLFGDEIPAAQVEELVSSSLDFPIPLIAIGDGVWALELFHGPTLAFKDVGARFMARPCDTRSRARPARTARQPAQARGPPVPTTRPSSWSPPRATPAARWRAVPGCSRVPRRRALSRRPHQEPQRKLITTLGGNVSSLAVAGSFDDCQRLVKEAFADPELRSRLRLASANSINVGRLLPQVLYYFLAVAQLPAGSPKPIIATPSGNFGNLTAGLYAKRLGLPVERFVAATNVNDVVPDISRPVSSVPGRPGGHSRTRWTWATLPISSASAPSTAAISSAARGPSWRALHRRRSGGGDRRGVRPARLSLDPHTAVGWPATARCAANTRRARGSFSPPPIRPTSRSRSRRRSGARSSCPTRCASRWGDPSRSSRSAPDYAEFRRFLVDR